MKTWEILGIEPTLEVSAIKRAYAQKLKAYHPEDDPQGFQMLREAYDSALKFAKNMKNKEQQSTEQAEIKDEPIEDYKPQQLSIEKVYNIPEVNTFYMPPPVNIVEEVINTTPTIEQLVEEFFKKVDNIYDNFFYRIDEKKWMELLNDEIMWRFDCKELINYHMLQFLTKKYLFPRNIWHVLNGIFHWDDQAEFLHNYFPETFVEYLSMKISKEKGPRYSYFDKNIQMEYDNYIYYSEEALLALQDNDLKRAEKYITLAFDIYSKDPDLLCIKGEYYLRIKKNRKALDTFKKAIKLNRKDEYIKLYQIEILLNNKKYIQAIDICMKRKVHTSKDIEWRTLLGRCYLGLSNWKEATKIFLGNLKIDPTNIETRRYLIQISNHLRAILEKRPLKLRLRKDLKKIYRALGEPKKFNELSIFYIVTFSIITFLEKCIERTTTKVEDGEIVLKMSRVYGIVGMIPLIGSVIVGVLATANGALSGEDMIYGLAFIGLFFILGLLLVLYSRNIMVVATAEKIIYTGLTGKTKKMNWDEVKSVSFNRTSMEITLKSNILKIKLHRHLRSIESFLKMMKENVDISICGQVLHELGIK